MKYNPHRYPQFKTKPIIALKDFHLNSITHRISIVFKPHIIIFVHTILPFFLMNSIKTLQNQFIIIKFPFNRLQYDRLEGENQNTHPIAFS